ncbi:Glu/Leu/Phe/Val dehydrogenase [Shimia biformata]|uniref:Glu/Leu/Phe/Val dehydrogenase n=1 Tax=Shimia biformata TaxID=1294299 RepID=UPI00194EECCC|nr:Glu/Leu/Phe/Val dehydrogenase [Shimia biformata]
MRIYDHKDFDGHEKVLFCHDSETGLRGIVAIHSTKAGPAAGGCRMYPYANESEALTDVLRLSRGMSYKNAMAGLPVGGGKAVVIADPLKDDKPALLRAFGRHIQALGGQYWTAIDVGVGPEDADVLAETCDFVFARASQHLGAKTSHFTALGGFVGIRAAAAHVWGRNDLGGLTVAIQGLGGTGGDLARQLHEAGAKLIVADVRADVTAEIAAKYDATPVDPQVIHAVDADVFAPCALGAILNDTTIPEIKAKVVCGVANNQLAEPRHGAALKQRGIAYVPDYVVNAGGIIGSSSVIYTTPDEARITDKIHGLYDTIGDILKRADASGEATSDVADQMARARLAA